MATPLPGDLFAGYQLLGAADAPGAQGIFIPLATLSGLTAAEAAEADGNGSKVWYELNRAVQGALAAMPAADRPTRMSLAVTTPTGVNATTVAQNYNSVFQLDVSAVDVAAEP